MSKTTRKERARMHHNEIKEMCRDWWRGARAWLTVHLVRASGPNGAAKLADAPFVCDGKFAVLERGLIQWSERLALWAVLANLEGAAAIRRFAYRLWAVQEEEIPEVPRGEKEPLVVDAFEDAFLAVEGIEQMSQAELNATSDAGPKGHALDAKILKELRQMGGRARTDELRARAATDWEQRTFYKRLSALESAGLIDRPVRGQVVLID